MECDHREVSWWIGNGTPRDGGDCGFWAAYLMFSQCITVLQLLRCQRGWNSSHVEILEPTEEEDTRYNNRAQGNGVSDKAGASPGECSVLSSAEFQQFTQPGAAAWAASSSNSTGQHAGSQGSARTNPFPWWNPPSTSQGEQEEPWSLAAPLEMANTAPGESSAIHTQTHLLWLSFEYELGR